MHPRSLVTSREDVWYDFLGSVGSKIAKKWENVFAQNVPGSSRGCRRGLVRVTQVGAAYRVRHPCKDTGTFWSNTFFHFLAIFDPTEL